MVASHQPWLILNLPARFHAQHAFFVLLIFFGREATGSRDLQFIFRQRRAEALWPTRRHGRRFAMYGGAHWYGTPLLLPHWFRSARRRCSRRPVLNRLALSLPVACWRKAKHRFHSVVISWSHFLAGFSACHMMTVLNLRRLLWVREKIRIASVPALNTLRQMRNTLLERRCLRLWLWLSGALRLFLCLAIKCLSVFHLA